MALEMKPACQSCERALEPTGEAFICTYECTFCAPCTEDTHAHVCPNCGGELVRRPRRKAN
ncbi:DUF1272 domain-containing protein [Hyphobacterium marinum]|uniref:DUF1272 domain-containing protein n=1 Tax=Hyphobacterium marinum TaxID=3116574 RepID=A0ABU7LUC3_9PROT|nr:DUF1272 domain-containing protein [Hyphobacterium sp. Y6023]MEE2565153.1 DUF1272 domain-containing protein [Hyphobacterium sp. Y6023]